MELLLFLSTNKRGYYANSAHPCNRHRCLFLAKYNTDDYCCDNPQHDKRREILSALDIGVVLVNIRLSYTILRVVVFLNLIAPNAGFFLGHNEDSFCSIRHD